MWWLVIAHVWIGTVVYFYQVEDIETSFTIIPEKKLI